MLLSDMQVVACKLVIYKNYMQVHTSADNNIQNWKIK